MQKSKLHLYQALVVTISLSLILFSANIFSIDFLHPSDVVNKMKKTFSKIDSYSANFQITTREKKGTKTTSGKAYFKKNGKINFTFSKPYGDKIISNGRKMWIYIRSLNAVGVQNLNYKKNGKSIYSASSYNGLINLFRRYHYRFETPDQPAKTSNGTYYVLALKEKVTSGGFSTMKVYVHPKTYLIHEIQAKSPSGKKLVLKLSNINTNAKLTDNLFSFKVEGNIKVVENPLTNF